MTLDELTAEALAEPKDEDRRSLSPREQEVVELVAQGLTNVQIAEKLFISKRTVETHTNHIKQKLELRNRHQIMAWALHNPPATPNPTM